MIATIAAAERGHGRGQVADLEAEGRNRSRRRRVDPPPETAAIAPAVDAGARGQCRR
jgi:hypothetical protein